MTDREVAALESSLHNITTRLTISAGTRLGQWAGHGCWKDFPSAFRAEAGARALEEINATLTELTALRDWLAALLDTNPLPPG